MRLFNKGNNISEKDLYKKRLRKLGYKIGKYFWGESINNDQAFDQLATNATNDIEQGKLHIRALLADFDRTPFPTIKNSEGKEIPNVAEYENAAREFLQLTERNIVFRQAGNPEYLGLQDMLKGLLEYIDILKKENTHKISNTETSENIVKTLNQKTPQNLQNN